ALTVAKVYCASKNISLYTISTLQLYAGLKPTVVLMDARANRSYCGIYDHGKAVMSDCVVELENIDELINKYADYEWYGDLHLINKEDNYGNIVENFSALRSFWHKWENVHTAVPVYLKENDAYGN
ncbi:MAG: tRNA (adenosine(37)-N6)-threonylcarbamoyltransferase complex dimerization subunit type 1 TsaB, partial [Erysipelotrichaceae bacterium]